MFVKPEANARPEKRTSRENEAPTEKETRRKTPKEHRARRESWAPTPPALLTDAAFPAGPAWRMPVSPRGHGHRTGERAHHKAPGTGATLISYGSGACTVFARPRLGGTNRALYGPAPGKTTLPEVAFGSNKRCHAANPRGENLRRMVVRSILRTQVVSLRPLLRGANKIAASARPTLDASPTWRRAVPFPHDLRTFTPRGRGR